MLGLLWIIIQMKFGIIVILFYIDNLYKPYKVKMNSLNNLYNYIKFDLRISIENIEDSILELKEAYDLPVKENCKYNILLFKKNKYR